MRIPSLRALVVDDFAPWRRIMGTILQNKPELRVVSEASDGLEAVRKAQELQPELILLDIRLPSLNGIEVARQIRKLAPKSKILFVSENYSADIAREALSAGGRGYVIKSDAGSELLPAVEAVILGKQFVSARLAGRLSTAVSNGEAPDPLHTKEILASFAGRLPRNQRTTRCHEVQIYSDETFFLERLSRFVGTTLDAGGVVVAFATEPHRRSFVEGLQACGLDVVAAMQRRSYVLMDVAEAISGFMVNDSLDPVRYLGGMADLVETALKAAKSDYPCIAACGELAVPLLAQDNTEAVIQIEQLSDAFANEYALDILCAYPAEMLHRPEANHVSQRIRTEHSIVYSH